MIVKYNYEKFSKNNLMEALLQAPSFIIHLEKYTERRNRCEANVREAGFSNVTIMSAVDGTDKEAVLQANKDFGNVKLASAMSENSTGCLFSHFRVLKHIIDHAIPLAVIFEDDVSFHPEWKTLAPMYYSKTPNDWDVLYIGNSVDDHDDELINTKSCFCRHAYAVTLNGAKLLLYIMLSWNWTLFLENIDGIYCGDIMIKIIQMEIQNKRLPQIFRWYCWNGTVYPCDQNRIKNEQPYCRNNGLAFQTNPM